MSKKLIKEFRSKQQVKDDQINYLLADVLKKFKRIQNCFRIKRKTIIRRKKNTAFSQAKLR